MDEIGDGDPFLYFLLVKLLSFDCEPSVLPVRLPPASKYVARKYLPSFFPPKSVHHALIVLYFHVIVFLSLSALLSFPWLAPRQCLLFV